MDGSEDVEGRYRKGVEVGGEEEEEEEMEKEMADMEEEDGHGSLSLLLTHIGDAIREVSSLANGPTIDRGLRNS